MRQSEPEGFIARNLNHRYHETGKRAALKADFAARCHELRCEVTRCVLGFVLRKRELHGKTKYG